VIALADVEAAVRRARARNTAVEGIEMFVGLEDLRTGVREERSAAFAELLAAYLAGLGAAVDAPTLDQQAQALELVAAGHFDVPVEDHLRVVNYHDTPRSRAGEYERQLAGLAEQWDAVPEPALLELLDGGAPAGRGGVVPVLYEGYRSSYEVALPLVERVGLRAWIVVPTAFVDAPVAEQRALAERCHIGPIADVPDDGRVAMTWDELRDAAERGHTIVCHTAHHRGISDLRTEADLRREIVEPRARLEQELGRPVGGLAFLWGSPLGSAPRVDAAVAEAGYGFVVSNTKLQRLG
jgi:hypothetical protein